MAYEYILENQGRTTNSAGFTSACYSRRVSGIWNSDPKHPNSWHVTYDATGRLVACVYGENPTYPDSYRVETRIRAIHVRVRVYGDGREEDDQTRDD
jgi:hypothetical protein